LVALEGGARLALGRLAAKPSARFVLTDVWDHSANSFHEFDPELTWRQVPGYRDKNVRINSLGMRGPEPRAHSADVRRVLVLGDSIAFGYAVAEEETFARLLERGLGAEGAEVLDAGVIGYSSFQGRRLYERLAPLVEPDLVLVQFGYNDHHSARFSDREKAARGPSGWRSWVRHTGVSRLVRRLAGNDATLREEPVARVSPSEFRENVLALCTRARTQGASIHFLSLPLRPNIPWVENFTRLQHDGQVDIEATWLPQIDVGLGYFNGPTHAAVQTLFLGGEGPDARDLLGLPRNVAQVERLIREFPELPIGHYLRTLSLAGHSASKALVADSEQRWRALDSERTALQRYNTILRELVAKGEIDLIDLAQAFGAPGKPALFRDVVHPSPAGHALIATEILRYLGEH